MSQTVIKIQHGTGYTKTGKEIPIYRKRVYKTNHPDYAKELAEKQAFEESQAKKPIQLSPQKGFQSIHVNSGPR